MNCNTPETTCGTKVFDNCVVITTTIPTCFPTIACGQTFCYRQSDYNEYVGETICTLLTDVATIQESIDLSTLTGCTGVTPIGATVVEEFQNIYDEICDLQTNLALPITGIDVECLVDRCSPTIGTLGQLLQAMVDRICSGSGKRYKATLKQSGTSAPVATILEDTLDIVGTNLNWAYSSTGTYTLIASGSLAGGFLADKTTIITSPGALLTTDIRASRTTTSIVTLLTGSSGTLTNGLLNETTIEITVYP